MEKVVELLEMIHVCSGKIWTSVENHGSYPPVTPNETGSLSILWAQRIMINWEKWQVCAAYWGQASCWSVDQFLVWSLGLDCRKPFLHGIQQESIPVSNAWFQQRKWQEV